MPFKKPENIKKVDSPSQVYPVGTTTFKIADLKRDLDFVKTSYECGSDPNKSRIERVLSNMKRKLIKAEQIMKFGHNITGYTITQDRIRTLLGRILTMKSLFKELMKDQFVMTKSDRRSLYQMYHQLLSMEDDLQHFTEPVRVHSSSTNCKNNEEQHLISIRDCEVQTATSETTPSPCKSKPTSPAKSALRTRPFAYPGIGLTPPKVELYDSSAEETRMAMITFNRGKESFQTVHQTEAILELGCSMSPSISTNNSLVSVCYTAKDALEVPGGE